MHEQKMRDVHKHCKRHRAEVLAGTACGCFYCQAIFDTKDIAAWIDQEQTAVCPRCGVDAVLPAATLSEFEDKSADDPTGDLLYQMAQFWFATTP